MVKLNGKRFNVLLTFDVDADSLVGQRGTSGQWVVDEPVAHSKGRFGPRVGLPRILNLLDKYSIKSTFFVPGWTAEKYPDNVKEIAQKGHEIAAHGYKHESLAEVKSPEDEVAIFIKSIECLKAVVGQKPVGFRAPFATFSRNTLTNLETYGFKYDSSLMDDDQPYVIKVEGRSTGLVELPIAWLLDDWGIFETHRRSPKEAFDILMSEFQALYAAGVPYFNLTMHPQVTGRASRMVMLEGLIRTMRRRKGVTFRRCADLANDFCDE